MLFWKWCQELLCCSQVIHNEHATYSQISTTHTIIVVWPDAWRNSLSICISVTVLMVYKIIPGNPVFVHKTIFDLINFYTFLNRIFNNFKKVFFPTMWTFLQLNMTVFVQSIHSKKTVENYTIYSIYMYVSFVTQKTESWVEDSLESLFWRYNRNYFSSISMTLKISSSRFRGPSSLFLIISNALIQ